MNYNTAIVLAGTGLLGGCAGLVGTFAVLRRRALTGDALAHAALPGLCAAAIVTGGRALPALLLGALVSGLIGVATISALRRVSRIKEDAAIGLVLSVFFGLGIVLSGIAQRMSDAGSKAGLDSFILGKTAGIVFDDVATIGLTAALCLAAIVALYKEFLTIAFDPGFASVQGWPVGRIDFVLMGLVAVAVVIGLPAVGVVLMAALLIIPGAAARFWSDRLATVLVLATAFGAGIGVAGTLLSVRFAELPAGPIIVLAGTTLFVVSMLIAPQRGLIARLYRSTWQRIDFRRIGWLRVAWPWVEKGAPIPELPWSRAALRAGVLRRDGFDLVLAPEHRAEAADIARADRLASEWLSLHPDSAPLGWRLDPFETVESIPVEERDRLEQRLRGEGRWPDEDREWRESA